MADKFNLEKFIHDVQDAARADGTVDTITFNNIIITALVKQLPAQGAQKPELTAGQKAARTRKRRAAKEARTNGQEATQGV